MTFRRRFKLSEQQRNDMWRRWKAGQSLHEIGRTFGKDHVSIQFMLAQHGGIAPAVRRRSPLTLTLEEREKISRGIGCGSSICEIAKGLQRAVSTVSREVARHGGRPQYRASDADQQAWESALRPKRCLLALHVKLQEIVAGKLILDWSPEQISGWLKSEYPEDESMRVSHETIYRSLFIQARGVLKKELIQHLRFQRRNEEQSHRHACGTSFAFCHAGQSAQQRYGDRGCRSEPTHWEAACHFAALVDLGSRTGDGPAQKFHGGHGSESLLLRSAKPVATRLERKHERPVASVLP